MALCLSSSRTQEKDGRDVNPVGPLKSWSSIWNRKTEEQRKSVGSEWRVGVSVGRSPMKDRMPGMSFPGKALSPSRTLAVETWWPRRTNGSHNSACGYRDWVIRNTSIYLVIYPLPSAPSPHPICLRRRVRNSWGNAGYINYHVI